jgi:hypothetical protein
MHFIETPFMLYQEQLDKLRSVSIDLRMEYEELAAYIEFDCGERRGDAERHAYCVMQGKYRWHAQHVQGYYPEPALKTSLNAMPAGKTRVRKAKKAKSK